MVGASGCGKSSIVRAGLLPRLARPPEDAPRDVPSAPPRGDVPPAPLPGDRRPWAIAEMPRLGENPLGQLEAALGELEAAGAGHRRLLFIDQFEELYCQGAERHSPGDVTGQRTVHIAEAGQEPSARKAFLKRLGERVAAGDRVIVTLGSDFQSRAAADLGDAFRPYRVPELELDELREVIERPAEEKALFFAPGLVEKMIEEVRNAPWPLPLLSVTLSEMYAHACERWQRSGDWDRLLTGDRIPGDDQAIGDYRAVGGVAGALRARATRLYQAAGSDQPTLGCIFLRLVSLEGGHRTRRRAQRRELEFAAGEDKVNQLLREWTEKRFLVRDGDYFEPASNALIREWEMIDRWIEGNGDFVQLLRELWRDVLAWRAAERDEGLLWHHDPRLPQLRVGGKNRPELNELEAEFVDASFKLREDELEVKKAQLREAERLLREATAAREAEAEARREADDRARVATANLRANQAVSLRASDPTLALNVALEARRLHASTMIEEVLQGIRREEAFYSQVITHSSPVLAVAAAPDGKTWATASEDGSARLWTAGGTQRLTLEGHQTPVRAVAFAPDGNAVLTGADDHSARLWNLEGDLLHTLEGHEAPVNAVACSRSGRMLTAGGDQTVRLWSAGGEPVAVLDLEEHDPGSILSAAFSPDETSILAGGARQRAYLVSLTGELLRPRLELGGEVRAVAFSPDGRHFLTAVGRKVRDETADRPADTIHVWDLQGVEKTVLDGRGGVRAAVFSPDGQTVLTGCGTTIRLWDLEGRELQAFKGHEGTVTCLAFLPRGDAFVSGSGHYSRGFLLPGMPDREAAIGKSEVTGLSDHTARLWHLPVQLDATRLRSEENEVASVAFSPGGRLVLTCSTTGTAHLWNRQGERLQSFPAATRSLRPVAFAPGGEWIATAVAEHDAALWDLEGGLYQEFEGGHSSPIRALAFSPGGELLLTGSGAFQEPSSHQPTPEVCFWAMNGEPLSALEDLKAAVTSISCSSDDRTVAIGTYDNSVHLYASGRHRLRFFTFETADRMAVLGRLQVEFSPDGQSLLTGSADGRARLWDLNGNQLAVFAGDDNIIPAIAFSDDGKYILTGSLGARLWDVSGQLLRSFPPSDVGTRAVGFSPEGDVLVAGEDDVVRRWRGVLRPARYARPNVTQKLALGLTTAKKLLRSDRAADLPAAASYYEHKLRQTRNQAERSPLTEALAALDRGLYDLATAAGDDRARSALTARLTGRMVHQIANRCLAEATATGRMVLEHDPGAEWTRSMLAVVYLADGRLEEQEEFFYALIGRHLDDNRRLLALLAVLLDRPDPPREQEIEWIKSRLGDELGFRAVAVIKDLATGESLQTLEYLMRMASEP